MSASSSYLSGFGNHFSTEALPDSLPAHQNSPQRPSRGLYAEQLSGTAFTMSRHQNFRSWVYRIYPSVIAQGDFVLLPNDTLKTAPNVQNTPPTPMRWNPLPLPTEPTDWLASLVTIATNGDASTRNGGAIHLYAANQNHPDQFFYNADGELLFIPQKGRLKLKTEMGTLEIEPQMIAVIPRGIKFQVELQDPVVSGYLCENYSAPFRLPDLGPIGANGLANPRDFEYPIAQFEDRTGNFELIAKFGGHLWSASIPHSPLDVVAWHGNYAPYRYDLRHFNTINTVSFDHPDPSIFTVLTSPSEMPGLANIDFVIFPDRWMVAENTFRPPYFHRNIMSEYMGLIQGCYDAKETGFLPGGGSLHNCFSAHGPDAAGFDKATVADLKPQYYRGTLAFMLESRYIWHPTTEALHSPWRQKDYLDCWAGLARHFTT